MKPKHIQARNRRIQARRTSGQVKTWLFINTLVYSIVLFTAFGAMNWA